MKNSLILVIVTMVLLSQISLITAQSNGVGQVWDVSTAGQRTQLSNGQGWSSIWDIIVPVETNSNTDLVLFYDKDTQRARFWTFDAQGQLDTNLVDATWNAWDIIVPFDTDNDGDDELLFYNSDGTANVWDVNADGSIRLLSQASGWSTIWDIIVPIETHGGTLMLFYDRDGQFARFWTFDTEGQLDTKLLDTTWYAWDIIVPFDTDNDGDDELLLYNLDGTSHVLDVRSEGIIRLLNEASGWSTIWDIIVPVENHAGTLMLFYDREGQYARFWTFDSQGKLDTKFLDTTWNTWDVIVPIDPDNDGQDELLYYSLQDNSNNTTLTHALTSSDTSYTVTFEINRLRVVNGEEDGTFASSGSDEFYMLYFLSAYEDYVPVDEVGRGWGVYEVRAGDEYMYTTSGRGQYLRPLSLTVGENTHFAVTVFMLESENDNAARQLIQQVTNSDRIMMPYVDDRFRDNQRADNTVDAIASLVEDIDYWLFGEHDLLGVRSTRYYLPTDIAGMLISGEWIVTGHNLADAYDYRLEYTISVVEQSD